MLACTTIGQGYVHGRGKLFDKGSDWFENIDRIFGIGEQAGILGQQISRLKGNSTRANTYSTISSGFGAANDALGAVRVIFPFERLVTGKMFIDQEGRRRSWVAIAQGLLTLGVRILSPINWLHKLGVYDLGNHSKRMNHATLGIWEVVIALEIVQDVHAQCNDHGDPVAGSTFRSRMKKRFADTLCNGLDMIALPFEFGLGPKTPEFIIAGAAINCLAKGSYLIKEAFYYDS